eukprot:scaffold105446_cov54-Phaeocystis_antarctica.AAC.1
MLMCIAPRTGGARAERGLCVRRDGRVVRAQLRRRGERLLRGAAPAGRAAAQRGRLQRHDQGLRALPVQARARRLRLQPLPLLAARAGVAEVPRDGRARPAPGHGDAQHAARRALLRRPAAARVLAPR